MKVVKQLFKHVYKGHDRVALEVHANVPGEERAEQRDEIRHYLDAR